MRSYAIRPVAAILSLIFSTAFTLPATPPADIPRASKYVTVDYSAIDSYARNTPDSYARNLNTLSDYLTAPARSDLAKARSVYAWIMTHIRYDESAYQGRTYSSEIEYANRVLRNRRAVCTGFALLYKHLLKRAGVLVMNVKGYSRAEDRHAGVPVGPIDHEWNAIRLDGDWYLLDLAWASTTAKDGRSNDHYFLTEPKQFVAQHLPADSRWQLLDKPVSKADFDRFPKFYDAYFRLGFSDDFPKNGLIRSDGIVTLHFENEEDVEFLCSYSKRGSATAQPVPMRVGHADGLYTVQVKLPQRGTSTLYVFAKPKRPRAERVKSYEGIASFTVVNEPTTLQ